jgi:hypothetical protein
VRLMSCFPSDLFPCAVALSRWVFSRARPYVTMPTHVVSAGWIPDFELFPPPRLSGRRAGGPADGPQLLCSPRLWGPPIATKGSGIPALTKAPVDKQGPMSKPRQQPKAKQRGALQGELLQLPMKPDCRACGSLRLACDSHGASLLAY